MKHYLSRISFTMMALGLVGLTALTALAANSPSMVGLRVAVRCAQRRRSLPLCACTR